MGTDEVLLDRAGAESRVLPGCANGSGDSLPQRLPMLNFDTRDTVKECLGTERIRVGDVVVVGKCYRRIVVLWDEFAADCGVLTAWRGNL